MSSLVPGQEDEARLWIVPHETQEVDRDIPYKVEWSGGQYFPIVACTWEENPTFCATLAYYEAIPKFVIQS
jgi:hypothetical protein